MTLLVERDHDAFALDAIKGGGEPEKVVKHLVNNLSSGLGVVDTRSTGTIGPNGEQVRNYQYTSKESAWGVSSKGRYAGKLSNRVRV